MRLQHSCRGGSCIDACICVHAFQFAQALPPSVRLPAMDRCSVGQQACRRARWYKHVDDENKWTTWLVLCKACERDVWRDCTKLEPGAWPCEGHTLYKWKEFEEENAAFLKLAMQRAHH